MRQTLMCVVTAVMTAAVSCPGALAQDADVAGDVKNSVVKVFATFRAPNFQRPWTKEAPEEFTGSGFVIDGERIITNAHVVEQASQVFVQPHQSSDRLRAEVEAINQDVDLAVLRLRRDSDREEFFASHAPVTFIDGLPPIGATVQAIGYPMGGEQLSVTEGVVSRIEFTGYTETFGGLRIQVDAPLNPGNSGGPMILDDKVIGVTFSGIGQAENIGYVIPIEEVNLFLEDVADGTYDGKPLLHATGFQTCENPALRDRLKLERSQTGLVFTDTMSDDEIPLEAWDVIDRVGEYDVDNAGLITIEDDLRVQWGLLFQRLGQGGSVPMTVIRDGRPLELTVPLDREIRDVIIPLGNNYPEYFVYGPLVFTKGYRELGWWIAFNPDSPLVRRGDQERQFDGEELVVISSQLLPHPITKGYEIARVPTVKSVNGVEIRNLGHLIETLRDLDDEYVEFDFYNRDQEILIFDREELEEATEEILDDNGIRSRVSKGMRHHWEG